LSSLSLSLSLLSLSLLSFCRCCCCCCCCCCSCRYSRRCHFHCCCCCCWYRRVTLSLPVVCCVKCLESVDSVGSVGVLSDDVLLEAEQTVELLMCLSTYQTQWRLTLSASLQTLMVRHGILELHSQYVCNSKK